MSTSEMLMYCAQTKTEPKTELCCDASNLEHCEYSETAIHTFQTNNDSQAVTTVISELTAEPSASTSSDTNTQQYYTRTTNLRNLQKKYACNLCNFEVVKKSAISKHIAKQHDVPLFSCQSCDYCTPLQNAFDKHVTKHTGQPFACNLCDYKTHSSPNFGRHMSDHTGVKPFACKLCDFRTVGQGALGIHMKTHKYKRVCKYCKFGTQEDEEYHEHMKIHLNSRKFACDLCTYRGKTKKNLKKHKKCHR